MGDPPASGARLARGAPGSVRRPFVPAGGDELRDQDREDDLARELGLRTAPPLGAQCPGEERAEIATHLRKSCHSGRIRPARAVRSAADAS